MTALERQRLYAFFSRLWVKEADPAFLEVLAGPLGVEVLGASTAAQARSEALDEDFAHLTIVDLVPYETFFQRDDAQIEAGGANPVATFLQKYGFEVDLGSARSLAPDHLGIELEVMSVLCRHEHEAREAGNEPLASAARRTQREFLVQHLLAWAPTYLFAARRNARTATYRDGAEATLQFICGDLEGLS
ncbi:MAG: molecular chaperone TorD family protein [Myxococcaceae bacterium]